MVMVLLFFPSFDLSLLTLLAIICVLSIHCRKIGQHLMDGINYVEHMLRTQLIAAIGKEVTPVDFCNYMVYHNRKLFKEQYQPIPFSYAIRQPDHFPEGER